MRGVWFFRSEGALGQAESQRWKKQVGCEKGIHTAEETIESNNGRGSTKWGKEREGVFPASSEKRLFFIFFWFVFFFFFLFRFCCYLWNQAVGLVYLSVCFVPVEIHESFFFSGPHLIRSLRPAQGSANGCKPFTPGRKKKQICHLSKQKKTSLLNLSISVVCLYQYPFFFFLSTFWPPFFCFLCLFHSVLFHQGRSSSHKEAQTIVCASPPP